jgi:hypothetical protein
MAVLFVVAAAESLIVTSLDSSFARYCVHEMLTRDCLDLQLYNKEGAPP